MSNVTRGCKQHQLNKGVSNFTKTKHPKKIHIDEYDLKVGRKAHNSGAAKRIRGQRCHEDGERAEKEVARMFRDFGFDAIRTGHWACELPKHKRGQFADITVDDLPVQVEVKYVKSVGICMNEWLDKNDCEAREYNREPVLAFRRHRRNWKCVIDLKEFLRLLAIEAEHEQKNGITKSDIQEIKTKRIRNHHKEGSQ